MNNIPRFPKMDIRVSDSGIKAITHVRVKRRGKYYKIKCSDEHVFHSLNSHPHHLPVDYKYSLRFINKFINECSKVEVFWRLPEKELLQELIKKGNVEICDMHLSNKELFLLETKLS